MTYLVSGGGTETSVAGQSGIDEDAAQLFTGARSTSPETAQRLMQGSLESDVDPRLGSEPTGSDIRRVNPTAQDVFSTGSAEDVTGPGGRRDPETTDPRPTAGSPSDHGVEGEGGTVNVFEEAAKNVPTVEVPDVNIDPDVNIPTGQIGGLLVGLGAVLVGIFALGQFAKGAGQGAVS